MLVEEVSTRQSARTGERWWRGAAIYQIYPRSFADTNGDGIGDLPGITAKLDYVASLGVDAVWLSPFFTSPMRDFGYDVADYCAVDSVFGSLGDFDALIGRAHELGLKVIIDQESALVGKRRHLSSLSAVVPGQRRRWGRRSARDRAAARLYRATRRRCDLAVADLPVADDRFRL